ncbi:MAG: hypothetical protein ISS54_07030 [Dehalococcoidia bacterium]|nr:hypothetical protein [Dehalococcoidia bacterium]
MDRTEIQNKIQQAKELVGGTAEDPFTQIAFGEVFRLLIQESFIPAAGEMKPEIKAVALPSQVSEFLAQTNIRTHVDRVVAILYYYRRRGEESMTITEFEEAYSSIRVKPPRNFSDLLAQCIRKGYVVEAENKKDGKKAWQITDTIGERYVREELAP